MYGDMLESTFHSGRRKTSFFSSKNDRMKHKDLQKHHNLNTWIFIVIPQTFLLDKDVKIWYKKILETTKLFQTAFQNINITY